MILQYMSGKGKCYLEADCIGLYEVDISEIEQRTRENILRILSMNIPVEDKVILDMSRVFDSGEIESCKKLKIAILSDAKIQDNNKSLLFGENTEVYLLNNSGKTIRKL